MLEIRRNIIYNKHGGKVMNEEVKKIFSKFRERKIRIEQKGFLKSRFFIDELNYSIEDDILELTDEDSEIYIKINTNQIYKIDGDNNKVSLYLDNDTMVEIVNI